MVRSVCVGMFALAGAILLGAADETAVFRSDVTLVRVDAQVLDRNNRALTGLRAEDFVLREEGKPQQIRNFASENMPLDVLLLLDVSASMRPHVQRIVSASHQALHVLGNQDRVAIMVFDRATRVRLQFRNNPSEVERELQSLVDDETFRGGTDITRALLDAADYVARDARPEARRAIVILTDDQTEFDHNEASVGRALTRANAVLCALLAPDAMRGHMGGMSRGGGGGGIGGLGGIILGGGGGPYGGRRRGGPGMQGPHTQSAGTASIARASGGDSMPVSDASVLEDTLSRLRQRYALYFSVPAGVQPGEERHISLELSDAARSRYPGVEMRYRQVYLAPSGGGAIPAGGEPTVITRGTSGDSSGATGDSATGPRRRVAVDQDDSRQGPLLVGAGEQATQGSTSASPTTPTSSTSASPTPASPAPAASPSAPASQGSSAQQPKQGGWRKLKPGEQP